ncbi:hypothetical protein SAMN05720487_11661 [Fibrobacter sp. UWT2]|uniref:hypothetical protein n=1 Tax=Fibrobacter sp. UWT2 TaxID=1896224 RepID=UPI00091A9236|nr:hypothetical protein [Fibrobacter sp. UWT2]SHL54925.1 hypothetical protein SAMN05720487_11661 [Fibrobacter sp. UWT2]
MYNMQSCSWFSNYYSEIVEIFTCARGTKIKSEFPLKVSTYASELQSEIYTKLMDGSIKNNKAEILKAVSTFVERKRRFRMSAHRYRF